jgi:hypothetical protein
MVAKSSLIATIGHLFLAFAVPQISASASLASVPGVSANITDDTSNLVKQAFIKEAYDAGTNLHGSIPHDAEYAANFTYYINPGSNADLYFRALRYTHSTVYGEVGPTEYPNAIIHRVSPPSLALVSQSINTNTTPEDRHQQPSHRRALHRRRLHRKPPSLALSPSPPSSPLTYSN